MYNIFSIRLMEREVSTIEDCLKFGADLETELANHFCEEIEFTAQYPEDLGAVFKSKVIGTKEELHSELKVLKRHVFRTYLNRTNPDTKKSYSSKEVIMRLLHSSDESVPWASPTSVLRYVMKAFLSTIVVSCDVERLMSVFTLYDSKLNQTSKALNVEHSVIVAKETPSWELFDARAVITLWRKQKDRRKQLPPIENSPMKPHLNKCWLKPHTVLKAGHKKRKARYVKRMESEKSKEDGRNADDGDDDVGENDEAILTTDDEGSDFGEDSDEEPDADVKCDSDEDEENANDQGLGTKEANDHDLKSNSDEEEWMDSSEEDGDTKGKDEVEVMKDEKKEIGEEVIDDVTITACIQKYISYSEDDEEESKTEPQQVQRKRTKTTEDDDTLLLKKSRMECSR